MFLGKVVIQAGGEEVAGLVARSGVVIGVAVVIVGRDVGLQEAVLHQAPDLAERLIHNRVDIGPEGAGAGGKIGVGLLGQAEQVDGVEHAARFFVLEVAVPAGRRQDGPRESAGARQLVNLVVHKEEDFILDDRPRGHCPGST
jgi:hypothetical protein